MKGNDLFICIRFCLVRPYSLRRFLKINLKNSQINSSKKGKGLRYKVTNFYLTICQCMFFLADGTLYDMVYYIPKFIKLALQSNKSYISEIK